MLDVQTVVDAAAVREHIANGLITAREDKELGITLLNYTNRAAHLFQWDETLMTCRGLGLDSATGEIVFRGPRKFFSYGQCPEEEARHKVMEYGSPTRTEKLDGAIGLGFRRNGQVYISTRGNIRSDIATHATELVRTRYPGITWPEGFTPFFEIITHKTRQIVDYGAYEDVIWLGLIENATGREMRLRDVRHFATVSGMECVRELDEIGEETNREGFVLTYWTPENYPYRIKMKFKEYLDQERVLKIVTPTWIWQTLRDLPEGHVFNPDPALSQHLQDWIRSQVAAFYGQFRDVREWVDDRISRRPHQDISPSEFRLPENKSKLLEILDYFKGDVDIIGYIAFEKLTNARRFAYKKDIGPKWVYDVWMLIRPTGKAQALLGVAE